MKERITTQDAFKKDYAIVAGFVEEFRDLNKIKFIILRDRNGTLQITLPKEKVKNDIFEMEFSKESVIQAKGRMVESKIARGGKEMIPDEITILSSAEHPLPIEFSDKVETDMSKRFDWRHLDLRNPKHDAIFRIKSTIGKSFREFLTKKDFVEVWTPGIISAASEGGTELYPVDYFEQKAYLAQSPQLYKQLLTMSNLERVFMIVPVWRAEKHNTSKHLNESRQMDIEAAYMDDQESMKLFFETVKYIIKKVKSENKKELELIGRNLEIPKVYNLSYTKIIKKLNSSGFKISYGEDISSEAEKKIAEIYGKDNLVGIHSWPTKLKPFYIMPSEENPEISKGFDVNYGGIEISSGGQRIHLPKLLEKRIIEQGLDPKNFEFYINSFKYGAPYHSGWSIGLERLTMTICGLSNIREACAFPRDRDRIVP